MKKKFEPLEIDVILLDAEDVIATSDPFPGYENPDLWV